MNPLSARGLFWCSDGGVILRFFRALRGRVQSAISGAKQYNNKFYVFDTENIFKITDRGKRGKIPVKIPLLCHIYGKKIIYFYMDRGDFYGVGTVF